MDRYETVNQPLFLTRAVLGDLQKEANFKVNRDASRWEEDIMTILHEQYPFLQEYETQIHMNKVDAETGMGVGQIVLDKQIGIPIIINAFKMAPLDLFYFDGKLGPLTKESLLGALQQTSIGSTVEPGTGESTDMSLYTDTLMPTMGRYSYASSLTFTQDQLEKALGQIGEQGLAYALGMNQSFRKVATAYATKAAKKLEKMASAPEKVTVKEARFELFSPIVSSGAYNVITGGMKKLAGFVFDTVIDLNNKVHEGFKLFCGFGGETALAEHMGGMPIEGDFQMSGDTTDLEKVAMHSSDLSPGLGFFWMSKKGHSVATMPVKILYRGTDSDGQPFMKIADVSAEGQTRKIYASGDYQGLLVDGDTVFMGPEWRWQRSNETVKVADTRTANSLVWPQGLVELRHKDMRFTVEGMDLGLAKEGAFFGEIYPALSKVAGDTQSYGLLNKVQETGVVFLEVTKTGGTNRSNRPRVPEWMRPVNLVKEAAFVVPVKYQFLKYAADITEKDTEETVDALLGLNFINDENIYRFLEKADVLEDAVNTLASLLLAARMGLHIEEGPIRTAMFALDEVTRQLRQLKNVTYGSTE